MRLLSRTQRHRRRDERRECQLVRRSARIQSERARKKRKGHTLKSAGIQRALAMGRALRRWRGSSTRRLRRGGQLTCKTARAARRSCGVQRLVALHHRLQRGELRG